MEQYVANMLWEYSALKSLFFSLKHKNIRHVVVVVVKLKNGRMHSFSGGSRKHCLSSRLSSSVTKLLMTLRSKQVSVGEKEHEYVPNVSIFIG